MRKLTRAALVLAVLVPAAVALAGHSSGGSHGGGSHGGGSHSGGSHGGSSHGGSSHGGWSHGSGSHGGSSHGGWSHGSGSHGGSGHGWHHSGSWHRGGGWIVYGGPFWGGWGWWGWGCPFFPDCYGPPYVIAGGDDARNKRENQTEEWGMVDIEIWPEMARVYLDGRYIGAADNFDGSDDYLYLQPGDYTLDFRLEGYESASMDLNVESGAKIELNRKLHKMPGATEVAPGKPPEPEGGLRRYWGKDGGKLVAYSGSGKYARNRRDTDDADDDADEGEASPTPAARLQLSLEPGDAVVYLDDHFIGTAAEISRADGGLPVAPGAHVIMATRPGFKRQTVRIEVSGGESKTVKLSLEQQED